mmetsp:Transcript_31023/g.50179  ORF Transcript_31023/g.50179 Transcript_31023/m.50179 type:complete len:196 (-) Transcript_31023:313-900(-)
MEYWKSEFSAPLLEIDQFFDLNLLVRKADGCTTQLSRFDLEVSQILHCKVSSTTVNALKASLERFRLTEYRFREIIKVAMQNPLNQLALKLSLCEDILNTGLLRGIRPVELNVTRIGQVLKCEQLLLLRDIRHHYSLLVSLMPLLTEEEARVVRFAVTASGLVERHLNVLPLFLPSELRECIFDYVNQSRFVRFV